eukprot:NODE_690_length_1509_cov_108.136986_g569_i0.p1 GENE.NODE_690_length_1509_cov_108.136986_g569_i0~~NODE_690_length_1509_cov_108.136986_g569_i0.p1  ORF type:complete len:375 (+),score=61.44 NODE_690_length_1509_cov_108.136986_g569_i0:49-1125(+)
MDVLDMKNGSYLCRSVPLPVGTYHINVVRLLHCSETLWNFWCTYNYTAHPIYRCPAQGRSRWERESAVVACRMAVEVRPGPTPPELPPPCQPNHSSWIPGYWRRREGFRHTDLSSIGVETLVRRADFIPTRCSPRPVDYMQCVSKRFVVFLGDSTMRNIYYSLARLLLNVTHTGSQHETHHLWNVSPRWSGANSWSKKHNHYTMNYKNPVYFAWASHTEDRAPSLPSYFSSIASWKEQALSQFAGSCDLIVLVTMSKNGLCLEFTQKNGSNRPAINWFLDVCPDFAPFVRFMEIFGPSNSFLWEGISEARRANHAAVDHGLTCPRHEHLSDLCRGDALCKAVVELGKADQQHCVACQH